MRSLYSILLLGIFLFTVACGHYHPQPTTRVADFNRSDSNHDNMLNFAEYQTLVSLKAQAGHKQESKIMKMDIDDSREVMKSHFHDLDMNDDGLLTKAELNAA